MRDVCIFFCCWYHCCLPLLNLIPCVCSATAVSLIQCMVKWLLHCNRYVNLWLITEMLVMLYSHVVLNSSHTENVVHRGGMFIGMSYLVGCDSISQRFTSLGNQIIQHASKSAFIYVLNCSQTVGTQCLSPGRSRQPSVSSLHENTAGGSQDVVERAKQVVGYILSYLSSPGSFVSSHPPLLSVLSHSQSFLTEVTGIIRHR